MLSGVNTGRLPNESVSASLKPLNDHKILNGDR